MIDDSKPGQKLGSFTLASADDFSYKDPIDGRWAQSAARFTVIRTVMQGHAGWTGPEMALTLLSCRCPVHG